MGGTERLGGIPIQQIVDRLSRITERPSLPYRAYVYTDKDPNAAALADGRIYLTTGLLNYLGSRSSKADEPFDSARSTSPRASAALGAPSERIESRGSGRMPSLSRQSIVERLI